MFLAGGRWITERYIMTGFRFELPEDTQRKIDLAGKVLDLKRLIDKRKDVPDSCGSVDEDLQQRYDTLKRRLDAWR